MPNGGYEPVPIREHDAIVAETKRSIAARSALMAISSSADLLGISFEEMIGVMNDERQVDRILDAMRNPTPKPEPADVPVTFHQKADHDPDKCLTCITNGWSSKWRLLNQETGIDTTGGRWQRGE